MKVHLKVGNLQENGHISMKMANFLQEVFSSKGSATEYGVTGTMTVNSKKRKYMTTELFFIKSETQHNKNI